MGSKFADENRLYTAGEVLKEQSIFYYCLLTFFYSSPYCPYPPQPARRRKTVITATATDRINPPLYQAQTAATVTPASDIPG